MPYKDIHFGNLIGKGCYGSVHKGLWEGQTVALKRIKVPSGTDAETVAAHSREIAALRYTISICNDCYTTRIMF